MNTRIRWQKSSFSGAGGEDCVEVAEWNGRIVIRESDNPNAVAEISHDKLATLLHRVKAGGFDRLTG